LLTEIAQI